MRLPPRHAPLAATIIVIAGRPSPATANGTSHAEKTHATIAGPPPAATRPEPEGAGA